MATTQARWFATVILMGLGLWAGAAAAQLPPTKVVISRVVQDNVHSGQTFVGTVMPVRRSVVGSAVEGRVLEFPVEEGQFVRAQEPLAQLRTRTFELEIAAARAELRLRQEELRELEAGSRPEEIEEARARHAAAQVASEYARRRQQRVLQIAESRSISEDEVDKAVTEASRTAQQLLEAKAHLDLVLKGPREEQILQAAARVEVAQEQLNRLEDILEKHTVRAPFDGYVVSEHTQIGHWIKQGDPVVEMVQLDQVDVQALVPEQHLQHLRLGDPARIDFAGIPQKTFTGTIVRIVPQADVRSRSFPVNVRVENELFGDRPAIAAGMLARATLAVGTVEAALLVPKDAIVLGGRTPQIFVVEPAPKKAAADQPGWIARSIPVELGIASGGLIQVKGNVQTGQRVVIEGNERLLDGQTVIVVREVKP